MDKTELAKVEKYMRQTFSNASIRVVARAKKMPLWLTLELGGPSIAAAYAVGRTGCWGVGDDYGRPWDGPLAVQFPEGAPPSTAGIMQQEFGVV